MRKNTFFAINRHTNTAVLLTGFSCWEMVQGAFAVGILLPDGQQANGIGRCTSERAFHTKAKHGGTKVLATSNERPA